MNESYEMDVPVGSAFMFDKVKCKHCGERIVLINYSMGPSWTHQPAGASFQDGTHQYCHRTVAEPDMTDQRPHSRACGWRKHEHGTECSTNCPTCGGKEMTAEPAHVCVFKLVVGDPAWKCEKCGKTMSAEELQELLDRQQ